MKQVDKAIFLHRIPYSESSLIVTLYTFNNGLQKMLFQGGKKKSAVLFPLAIGEITYYSRPESTLGKLTAFETSFPLQSITSNPFKSIIVFFLAEIIQNCLRTDEKETNIFRFLEDVILSLESSDDIANFPVQFLIDFAEQLGIQPHIEIENGRYFNLNEGLIGNFSNTGDVLVQGPIVEALQQQLTTGEIHLNSALRKELLSIMLQYYQMHIPQFKDLKTLEIVREILN